MIRSFHDLIPVSLISVVTLQFFPKLGFAALMTCLRPYFTRWPVWPSVVLRPWQVFWMQVQWYINICNRETFQTTIIGDVWLQASEHHYPQVSVACEIWFSRPSKSTVCRMFTFENCWWFGVICDDDTRLTDDLRFGDSIPVFFFVLTHPRGRSRPARVGTIVFEFWIVNQGHSYYLILWYCWIIPSVSFFCQALKALTSLEGDEFWESLLLLVGGLLFAAHFPRPWRGNIHRSV